MYNLKLGFLRHTHPKYILFLVFQIQYIHGISMGYENIMGILTSTGIYLCVLTYMRDSQGCLKGLYSRELVILALHHPQRMRKPLLGCVCQCTERYSNLSQDIQDVFISL